VHVTLTAPYADVRAADLVLALNAPRVPALETLRIEVGGLAVELALLGHSHQIVAGDLVETVACVPGQEGDLPSALADGRYAFTASVRPLDAHAGAIAAAVADDPRGLVGVFAGDAFTALRAEPHAGGVRWETWHAYPQTGELVHTTGALA
jgi:hypothetical protein